MSDWSPDKFWKNYRLGTELSVSGNFIYNAIYCFDLMEHFYYEDESFEFLYNISIGIERLQKIVLILLTHESYPNQIEFEKSLITHNHQELNSRIIKERQINLGKIHYEFLDILMSFYKTDRYGKYSLESVYKPDQASEKLISFIEKHLEVNISKNFTSCTPNSQTFKDFIGNVIKKLCIEYYNIIKDICYNLNIYTYEVPLHSKAYKIFMAQEFNFREEKIIQAEILKHLLQNDLPQEFKNFLNIKPALNLGFYEHNDYVTYLLNPHKKNIIIGEISELYTEQVDDIKDRLRYLSLLGINGFDFTDN